MHSTRRQIAVQLMQLPKVNLGFVSSGYLARNENYATTAAAPAVCPHLMDNTIQEAPSSEVEWDKAIPYAKIPGPRALPILGNTFR